MIPNGLENTQINYDLNTRNFKKISQEKWDHTLKIHGTFCTRTSHLHLCFKGKEHTCVLTHTSHKCTWSIMWCDCVSVTLLESLSFCITSSMSWHFSIVNKLGNGTILRQQCIERHGKKSSSWSKDILYITLDKLPGTTPENKLITAL